MGCSPSSVEVESTCSTLSVSDLTPVKNGVSRSPALKSALPLRKLYQLKEVVEVSNPNLKETADDGVREERDGLFGDLFRSTNSNQNLHSQLENSKNSKNRESVNSDTRNTVANGNIIDQSQNNAVQRKGGLLSKALSNGETFKLRKTENPKITMNVVRHKIPDDKKTTGDRNT